jgi:hypothetical protein
MNYEKLIESLSHIVENEKIEKKGLTMTYTLSEEEHINLSVDLYYKTNQQSDFNPEEDFEVEIGGILVKFVKNF